MKRSDLKKPSLVCLLALVLTFAAVPAMAQRVSGDAKKNEVKRPPIAELSQKINRLARRHRGKVAVVIKHLPSGEVVSIRADEPMPTASLIKFPLLMAAYDAIERGEASLDQKITLKEDDPVPGSGVLTTHFSPGTVISLRDAMQLMMAYSDNTATNMVIDAVGLDATNKLMEKLECPSTRLNSKVFRRDTSNDLERSKKFGLGSTSCTDIIKLLEMVHDKEFLSKDACKHILDHLYACEFRTKFPRMLPESLRVAHKTGSTGNTRCDAGLVDTPSGMVAFCVLTTDNEDKSWGNDNEAELMSGEIGLATYRHFSGDAKREEPPIARNLKMGAQGDLVEDLQRTLNKRLKPSPGLMVDGDFGPNTESAVVAFQRQKKLDPNGVVDRGVWKALGAIVTKDDPAPEPSAVAKVNSAKEPLEPLNGPPLVTCKAWVFVDAETGEVIAGMNENGRRDPASTTKMMTAWLVAKLAQKDPKVLDQQVVFSKRADETVGSTSGVKAGEQVPVGELLYGLMLPSGNDASVALAEHFGEQITPDGEGTSYDRFIDAMNAEADALGMDKTEYRNPHGLTHAEHYTSAVDLTKLARKVMEDDLLKKVVATRQYVTTVESVVGYEREVFWKNTNQLLAREGYLGVKTGTTGKAGACLVSCAEREGHRVIGVVLGATSGDARYVDSRNLYRWLWKKKVGLVP